MQPDEATVQEALTRDVPAMLEAMKLGVAAALRKHQEQGVPIITWDAATQQIVETPADQIPGWIHEVEPKS